MLTPANLTNANDTEVRYTAEYLNETQIVAILPGIYTDTLLLNAHYDSVSTGPGASDNGAGVAVALQTFAMLATKPQMKNTFVRWSYKDAFS
jgi:Zn-dependent M28 family amino/carboxypeptidase